MSAGFHQLELIIRRAPLGLRFLDLARGLPVSDSLSVTAFPLGGPDQRRSATLSPISGVYGFRSLPGLGRYEQGLASASEWCAAPADGGTPSADALHDLVPLRALVEANASATTPNFAVEVVDRSARFLPQALQLCLPKEHIVEVPLFSAPSRLSTPGSGLVRGELHDPTAQAPARWAIVTVRPGGGPTYVGVADGRGMFVVALPYASALPAGGGMALDQLTWALSIGVLYQPAAQRDVPGASAGAPPDIRSILEQAPGRLHDASAAGAAVASITRPIRFGADLIVKTGGETRLLVEPAL